LFIIIGFNFITDQSKNVNYKAILNDISISQVRMAGTILDGCKVKITD
jgi:hypothetical protein